MAVKGVRSPQELTGLKLSQRLMVRVGALLKKNFAITPAVLESAPPGSALETLLLDADMLGRAGAMDLEWLRNLAAKTNASVEGFVLFDAEGGMRVLCLQDEVDAGESWGAAPPQATQPAAIILSPAAAPLAGAGQAPSNAQGQGPFAPVELDRLRLRVLTAASPAERIEALRTLALLPLPDAEKLDLLLQGLADQEPAVRAEAANLLPCVGGDRDIADALAAINHSEAGKRMAAADRLLRLITQRVQDVDLGATAMCVLSTLKRQSNSSLTPRLLEVLRACAPALSRSRARLLEIVRVVTELAAAASQHGASSPEFERTLGPIHRLLAALCRAAPAEMMPVLRTERDRCTEPAYESLLLLLMLDFTPPGAEGEDELVKMAAHFLARDKEEGRDSRAVGTRLIARGDKCASALCELFAGATSGAQKYFLLLLDDLWRQQKLSGAALQNASQVILSAIETGSKGLRMSAMLCRFPCDPQIELELRRKLAEAFLNSLSDFVFDFEIEKVEATISRMGLPAIEALLLRLSAQRSARERVRAVRLLGELAVTARVGKGEFQALQQSITEVLRRVEALSLEADFPDRGELLCAMGKLAATPAAAKETGGVIERTLLLAARNSDDKLSSRALEGLSHLAGSRRATPELVTESARLLRSTLDKLVFDISAEQRQVRGESVLEISGGDQFVRILPIALGGLARIANAPQCPPAQMRDIGLFFLERWRSICAGDLIWGPANTALLIQALKELGCSRSFPSELRMEIIKSLAPRHPQTPVMHALSEMLAIDDTPASGLAALTLGQAFLSRKGKDGEYDAADREDILRAATRVAARRFIGPPGDAEKARAFRQVLVDELFRGLKDLVPNSYESLSLLRDKGNISAELREDIDRRLQAYQSLSRQ